MSPLRWLRVAVAASDPVSRDLVADLLLGVGGRAVMEEGGDLVTYVAPPDDLSDFMDELATALQSVRGAGGPQWSWQPHRDWESAWREGLEPRRVGRRLLITPTWIDAPAGPSAVVIRIDPGVAFGTAEHATTRLALRHLDDAMSAGDSVLDVGTGSGILAIASAKLGAAHVHAMDDDPLACDQAHENVVLNEVESLVAIEQARMGPDRRMGPFDGVVANIVSGVLLPLIPSLARAIRGDGWIVVSGFEAHEAPHAREVLAGLGLRLVAEAVEEGWWGGWLRQPAQAAAPPAH